MKHKQKKTGLRVLIIALFLLVPILIAFFILGQNLDPDLEKGTVTKITVILGDKTREVKEKEDLRFFVSVATGSSKIEKPAHALSEYRKCEVVFHKINNDVTYLFYLSDSVNDCVYTDPDGGVYLIPQERAKELLAHSFIGEFAVSYAAPPELRLVQTTGSFSAEKTEGEWTYSKTNETQSTQKVSLSTDQVARLPQGEKIGFQFTTEPDFCSVILTEEDGSILYTGDYRELPLVSPEEDCTLTLSVSCDWYEDEHAEYHGSLVYTFRIFYDIPTLCQLSSSAVQVGESFVITISHTSSESIAVSPTFAAGDILVEKNGTTFVATLPVLPSAMPGEFSIMIMGSDVEQNLPVTVLAVSE